LKKNGVVDVSNVNIMLEHVLGDVNVTVYLNHYQNLFDQEQSLVGVPRYPI